MFFHLCHEERQLEEIIRLRNKINFLKQKQNNLLNSWAKRMCPYAIGDSTFAKDKKHDGKSCIIRHIYPAVAKSGNYTWAVDAALIKKDGSEGRITIKWTADDESWGE